MNPDRTDAPERQATTHGGVAPELTLGVPTPQQVPPGASKPALDAKRELELRGLNAFYGAHHAVKDVQLHFAAAGVTAIIGPSGCGKSTTVRCINRMHEETSGARAEGEVLLDGVDLYGSDVDVAAVRRSVGMVFQRPNPVPDDVDLRQRRFRTALNRHAPQGDRGQGA